MEGKLTLKINGKEVEADLEEWERLCVELNSLFNRQSTVYIPYPQPVYPNPLAPMVTW